MQTFELSIHHVLESDAAVTFILIKAFATNIQSPSMVSLLAEDRVMYRPPDVHGNLICI